MSDEMTNVQEEQHHPYGPSRWPGLCVCPGYEPKKTAGEYAERGTAIHLAMETGDFSKLREEDREVAEWMNVEVLRMTQGLDTESEVKTRIPDFENESLSEVGGVTGTCDRRWRTEDGMLHILDFKAFSKIGMHDHRAQLAGYILDENCPTGDRVVCHVFHGGSRQIETFDMTFDEVKYYAEQVAWAIANPDAPRCRSIHCDHCAKAGDCPESAKVVAYGAMSAGKLTADMVRSDPASAARLCDWLDMAAKRIDEARDIIASVAKEGVEIADPVSGIRYGLQVREGRAKIPPLSEIIGDLTGKDGVTQENLLERATLTLTALRELVGKKRAEDYAVRGDDIVCFVRKSK